MVTSQISNLFLTVRVRYAAPLISGLRETKSRAECTLWDHKTAHVRLAIESANWVKLITAAIMPEESMVGLHTCGCRPLYGDLVHWQNTSFARTSDRFDSGSLHYRGVVQLARMLDLGSRGFREFESHHPDHYNNMALFIIICFLSAVLLSFFYKPPAFYKQAGKPSESTSTPTCRRR